MESLSDLSKLKFSKTQIKISRRRHPLATIKLNQADLQLVPKKAYPKRAGSILKLTRRLSSNSLSKKSQQILNFLTKMPKKDKHLTTAELKCLMMGKHTHDSYLLDQRITTHAIQKIRNSDRLETVYNFKYAKFILLSDNIIRKCGDSQTLLSSYEQCMKEQYPPTVQLMLVYLGVFLYSINSQYDKAERYCQRFFDIIVKYKVQEFFIIYLLLRIKIKTNLSEWEGALTLLTKLVFFSWLYHLTDLQIWCYFELSRVYFFMQKSKQSQIFKIKSQTNSLQPKRSIYRQVSVSNLIIQIQSIWQGKLDFDLDKIIQQSRLSLPESIKYGVEEYVADQRRLKTNIKGIIQDCKIRHVNNLLTRMSEINMHNVQKQYHKQNNHKGTNNSSNSNLCSTNLSTSTSSSSNLTVSVNTIGNNYKNMYGVCTKSGNNFLLTHQSFNKNMNMFFRKRCSENDSNQRIFYTIENSIKNWGALKEMLKNIFIQMTFYTANINI